MFGYTWVSFGLEAVSWWHRAIYCTVLSPPTPPVGHCSEPWYWSDDIGAAAGRTGSASPSLVVGQMVALNIYSVLLRPADMYCARQSAVSHSRRFDAYRGACWPYGNVCGIVQSGRSVVRVGCRRPSRAVSRSSVGH